MNKNKPIAIFYAISPVHIRNLEILSKEFKNLDFRVVYEPELEWFTNDIINKYNFECIPFLDSKTSNLFWSGNVRVVIMSTAQVRKPPLNLIQQSMIRKIPTVCIEETHQMLLQKHRINNYILPVDYLLVASQFEKNAFIKYGYKKSKVHTVGWPFIKEKKLKLREFKENMRKKLKVNKNQKIATLVLIASNKLEPFSIENENNRIKLLKIVSRGLPENYKMLIKAHPAENNKKLTNLIKINSPRATLVERYTDMQDILEISDVVFNVGYSQAIIESLLKKIPIIFVDLANDLEIFKYIKSEIVIRTSEEIPDTLKIINQKKLNLYKDFYNQYLGINSKKAIKNIVSSVNKIIKKPIIKNDFLDLVEIMIWYKFLNEKNDAINLLKIIKKESKNKHKKLILQLENLIYDNLTRNNAIHLISQFKNKLCSHAIKSIWINNMILKKGNINNVDEKILSNFPPVTSRERFISSSIRFGNYLLYHNKINSYLRLNEDLFSKNMNIRKIISSRNFLKNLYHDIRMNLFLIKFYLFRKIIFYLGEIIHKP